MNVDLNNDIDRFKDVTSLICSRSNNEVTIIKKKENFYKTKMTSLIIQRSQD
jgi:hypothetical protein